MEKLEAIGYLSGYKTAPNTVSVTVYDSKRAYNGLNLYCSGHGPEAILMDMKGEQLHTWRRDVWSIWPDFKPPQGSESHESWRRVHLFANGDLLAVFTGAGLVKLNKDSNVLWAYRGEVHHDLFVDDRDTVYVLTREAKMDERYHGSIPILEDFVTLLDPGGNEIKRVSVLRSLENSYYFPITQHIKEKMVRGREVRSDLLHTNTIELLDNTLAGLGPPFKEGNVLISPHYPGVICVMDLDAEKIVWAMAGMWRDQHQPTVLANGNILIFDNQAGHGASRILEFDPLTQDVAWSYEGTPEHPFYTQHSGSCQRLPNGNTLITESDTGRAFEVTAQNEIVWEFFNPHRAGEKHELIATLPEVIRIDPTFPTDWGPTSPSR
jgi:hypothetical protein